MIYLEEKRRFTFANFLHLFIQVPPFTHSAMIGLGSDKNWQSSEDMLVEHIFNSLHKGCLILENTKIRDGGSTALFTMCTLFTLFRFFAASSAHTV